MNQIFIILGYGIPKDIFSDSNYFTYLSQCYNFTYQKSVDYPQAKQIIFFTGGNTDCFSPFKRKESVVIKKRLFDFDKSQRLKKKWKIISESNTLSTLENIWFAKEKLQRYLSNSEIYCFCEYTRVEKVQKLFKLIFKNRKIKVIPIDFDTSSCRYLDKKFIKQKEELDYQLAKQAISDPKKYKIYHLNLEDKLRLLRKTSPQKRALILAKWWRDNLKLKIKNY